MSEIKETIRHFNEKFYPDLHMSRGETIIDHFNGVTPCLCEVCSPRVHDNRESWEKGPSSIEEFIHVTKDVTEAEFRDALRRREEADSLPYMHRVSFKKIERENIVEEAQYPNPFPPTRTVHLGDKQYEIPDEGDNS